MYHMQADEGLTYQMPLEVYLQGAVVRGVLVTNQDRLSNYLILRAGDEVFSLRAATLENRERKIIPVPSDDYLIYLQGVFLIADLSPQLRIDRSGLEGLYVRKDASVVLLSVGPYSVQGTIHTLPGGALHDVLVSKTRFIPVTGATLLDRPDLGPRTYLVNKTKIGFITALNEGLTEL
jgi:hypothetical protein